MVARHEATDKLYIFEERQLRKAADALKDVSPHKETLIAVGESEPSYAPGDERLDQSRLPGVIIQSKSEPAAPDLGAEPGERFAPAGRQARVCMKEEQPCPRGQRRATVHLMAAAGGGSEEPRPGMRTDDLCEARITAAVDDHHVDQGIWLNFG